MADIGKFFIENRQIEIMKEANRRSFYVCKYRLSMSLKDIFRYFKESHLPEQVWLEKDYNN